MFISSRDGRVFSFLMVLSITVSACGGYRSSVYAPLFEGKTFYLCCNMYYPGFRFHDANFQWRGTFIPLGTKIKVVRLTDVAVDFIDLTKGQGFIWIKRYATVPLASLLRVWFVTEDPTWRLEKFSPRVQKLIRKGQIEPGMTKEQVIMALGFPPQHRTPDTSSDKWIYFKKKPYCVYFENGVVSKIE